MLQFKHLTMYREGLPVCRDLFLDVGKGACLVISGRNGSGKSSVIACLIGHLKPTSGQVLLDQHDLHHLSIGDKKKFLQSSGIVLQHLSLRPLDSVAALLAHLPSTPKEIEETLTFLGLNPGRNQLFQELSYSQQRRLELALSVLKKPRMLIWDEPLLGLDPESQEKIKSILLKTKQSGTTIILATSHPAEFNFLNPEKLLKL